MTTSTSHRSSSEATVQLTRSFPVLGGQVRIRVSTRPDGNFDPTNVDPAVLEARRRRLVDLPWTQLDERHGTDHIEVSAPGAEDGSVGDLLATSCAGAVLGIWVGDCAPVVLIGQDGRVVALHAGWRGLAAGVIDVGLELLGASSPAGVRAWLGPCIGPCCYEFGLEPLEAVATGVRASVADLTGTDRSGRRALDVRAAVRSALRTRGVGLESAGVCTGCDRRFFSHRVRRESDRHVVAVWRQEP